ncbi:MAG TPA: protein translocase subunit SecDF, partial [Cryomorphaceae bacterium]|nr:protein translocase subunit SecDF [Cryomorphaceae bacterium]
MQNKGVIRLFAIIFALACLYQLSFTYVANKVENDAEEYAQGDLAKKQRYLDSINSQTVYNLGIDEFTYAEVKEKEINLGLDLRGGMNVILEVSVKDILRELSNDPRNPVLQEAFQRADKKATTGQDNYLSSFFESLEEIKSEKNLNVKLSDPSLFGTKELNDKLGFNAEDNQVKEELNGQVNAAVENVYTVLRARIDQFGVVQPNIQRLDNSGRILVELPGVKDPDRVKKLLQATAELEFWNVYNGSELIGFLNAANETLKTIVENPRAKKDSLSGNAVSEEELADDLNITAVDDQTDNIALKDTGIIDANETDGIDSLLVGTEADSLAADSAAATTFNPLYEVMFPNVNFQTGEPNPGPMVGYASVKDTGKVKEYLSNPKVKNLLTGNARY